MKHFLGAVVEREPDEIEVKELITTKSGFPSVYSYKKSIKKSAKVEMAYMDSNIETTLNIGVAQKKSFSPSTDLRNIGNIDKIENMSDAERLAAIDEIKAIISAENIEFLKKYKASIPEESITRKPDENVIDENHQTHRRIDKRRQQYVGEGQQLGKDLVRIDLGGKIVIKSSELYSDNNLTLLKSLLDNGRPHDDAFYENLNKLIIKFILFRKMITVVGVAYNQSPSISNVNEGFYGFDSDLLPSGKPYRNTVDDKIETLSNTPEIQDGYTIEEICQVNKTM